MFVDYYEIIQVHPLCEDEVLNRMRKHYALKYHPDKAPAAKKSEYTEILQRINHILDILLDSVKRNIYNEGHPYFNNRKEYASSGGNDSSNSKRNASSERSRKNSDSSDEVYAYAEDYPIEIRKYLKSELLFEVAVKARKKNLFKPFERKQFYNFANRIKRNTEFTPWQAKNIANYIEMAEKAGVLK